MKIERRKQLSAEEFVEAYLAPGRPVIVTDAMLAWSASSRLNPAYVERELGQFDVLVYDNLFDLQDICLLSRYLKEHFNKPDDECHLYVRAYSQLRSVDFVWADSLLDRFKEDWRSPYFLPESEYVVPFYMGGCTFNPACHRAPYRGLFISGKGARTRLHRDPFTSSAMLCQFYGQKSFRLWSPEQAPFVINDTDFVDPIAPDLERFPNYHQARVTLDDILSPGEIIFLPGGWFHDVTCISDSISITWNFVHRSRLDALIDSMRTNSLEKELEVVQFFLEPHVGKVGINQLVAFFEERKRSGAWA